MSVLLRERTDALDVGAATMRSWTQVSVNELMRDCSELCGVISEIDSHEISNSVMRLAIRIIELSPFDSVVARAAEELLQCAADELQVRKWSTDEPRQAADGARLLGVALGARDDALAVCALRYLCAALPESIRTRV